MTTDHPNNEGGVSLRLENVGLLPQGIGRLRRRTRSTKDKSARALTVGLINNMPKAAQEATERQFRFLLERGAGSKPFQLRVFQLTKTANTDATEMDSHCTAIGQIWDSGLDALIVTGAEPRAANLRDEPYWTQLVEILDWADWNRTPVILSCLAAHAAVLHTDGISRRRLPDKCFGVFRQVPVSEHPITRGLAPRIVLPHSRWNEVEERSLVECGYEVLTRPQGTGVDIFAKQRRSLTLYFQGHPEYEPETLALEYRRDVRRFLLGVQDTYPKPPSGYFDPETGERLEEFRQMALANRCEGLMDSFPATPERTPRRAPWREPAVSIFRNWIAYVDERRA